MRHCCLVLLILNFSVCSPAAEEGVESTEDFQKAYAAASAKLEEPYRHVKMVGTLWRADEDEKFSSRTRVEFLREGGAVRRSSTVLQSANANVAPGEIYIEAGDGEKYFSVSKKPATQDFSIMRFNHFPESRQGAWLRSHPAFAINRIPFNDEKPILDYVRSAERRVVIVRKAELDGNKVISVEADHTVPEIGVIHDQFWFQPETYALAGYRVDFGPVTKLTLHGRLTYEANSNPPRLKRIESWRESPPRREAKQLHFIYDFESVEFGPIDKKEFTLASLGIPEPMTRIPAK